MKKIVKKKEKPSIIQVTELDGKAKRIGRFFKSERLFRADRKKSEHFMYKYNAWGLDAKVVDFLVKENSKVIIRDTESKWEFQCDAGDFKIYGKLEEHNQHRPQYFLSLDHWTIIKAKNLTCVLKCMDESCRHNYAQKCVRGVIEIDSETGCTGYEGGKSLRR